MTKRRVPIYPRYGAVIRAVERSIALLEEGNTAKAAQLLHDLKSTLKLMDAPEETVNGQA